MIHHLPRDGNIWRKSIIAANTERSSISGNWIWRRHFTIRGKKRSTDIRIGKKKNMR